MRDCVYKSDSAEDSECDPRSRAYKGSRDAGELGSCAGSYRNAGSARSCREKRADSGALVLPEEGQDSCENCQSACSESCCCSYCSVSDLLGDEYTGVCLISSSDFYSLETFVKLKMIVSVIEVSVTITSVENACETAVRFCCHQSSESVSYLLLAVFVLSEFCLTIGKLLTSVSKLFLSVSEFCAAVSEFSRSCLVVRLTLSILCLSCCKCCFAGCKILLTLCDLLFRCCEFCRCCLVIFLALIILLITICKFVFTGCEILLALRDLCSCICEFGRCCCVVSFALSEFCLAVGISLFAVCESLFTVCDLVLAVKICLFIFFELIKTIFQLVHISCGLLTFLFPIVLARKNIIKIHSSAIETKERRCDEKNA